VPLNVCMYVYIYIYLFIYLSVAWKELMWRRKWHVFNWSLKHVISVHLQLAEFINFSWPSGLLVQVQYKHELKYFQLKASSSHETKIYVFDADHERRRKEQLKRIFERTTEQVLLKNLYNGWVHPVAHVTINKYNNPLDDGLDLSRKMLWYTCLIKH
jgi:hypothetical protein